MRVILIILFSIIYNAGVSQDTTGIRSMIIAYEIQHPDIYIAIKHAIEKLPPRCSQIFKLSRFEGLRYAEIAEYLNLSPKTVEVPTAKVSRSGSLTVPA